SGEAIDEFTIDDLRFFGSPRAVGSTRFCSPPYGGGNGNQLENRNPYIRTFGRIGRQSICNDDFRFTIGVLSTRRACGGTLISCVNGWSVSRDYQLVARLKLIQLIPVLGGMNIITIRK